MNVTAHRVLLTSAFTRAFGTRAELTVNCLFYVFIVLVFVALWGTVGQSVVAGYSYESLLWYLVATEAAVVPVPSKHIEEIGRDIDSGKFETELLLPMSPADVRLCNQIGSAIARACLLLPVGFVVVCLIIGSPPNLLTIPATIVSTTLAIACNYVGIYLFAAAAFWIREARATWFLYQKLIFFMGGMIIPLQFLPDFLQTVAWFLPFWTMAYAPGRLLSGHHDWYLLVGQVIWLVSMLLTTRAVYAVGERRVQAGMS